MIKTSITNFKNNLAYYIKMSANEDIHVTRYGKVVAVLSNPDKQYYQTLFKLCGALKEFDNGKDYQELIGEGLYSKYNIQ